MTLRWARLAGVVVAMFLAMSSAHQSGSIVQAQSSSCGMQLNETSPIFCDQFDQPQLVTNRSGQLDGVVWGVSRLRGQGTYWATSTIEGCGGPQAASPIGATDVIVCNGQLRESTNDDHDVTVLAMYPKQPFDFADRTGTVAFDVSNDTTGTHGAWPEFWLTDQPVPAPFWHSSCAFCSLPRHAIGIRFGGNGGTCPGGWRADSAIVVRDYLYENRGIYENNATGMQIKQTGCAGLSTGPNGGLSHVEIRIAQNSIDVYATDAGTTAPLRLINTLRNVNLSFTKGLVWIEDAHYNAEKAIGQPSQKTHTYAWDNVAFDGPATYRDLSFDVLDSGTPRGSETMELGWNAGPFYGPAHLVTLPMTTANITAATGALLMFNFGLYVSPATFTYTVNGHPNTFSSPLPARSHGMQTIAMPVPKEHLLPGGQDLLISSDMNMSLSNVNLVLVAASSVPGTVTPPPPPPPPPPDVCEAVVRWNGSILYVTQLLSMCAGVHP